MNTEGSFECECDDGYDGDGRSCEGNLYIINPVQGRVIRHNRRPKHKTNNSKEKTHGEQGHLTEFICDRRPPFC